METMYYIGLDVPVLPQRQSGASRSYFLSY
jgi:hypothetical protein